jgi:hypothetical protein
MTKVVHPSGVTYVRISDRAFHLPRCGVFVSVFPAVPLPTGDLSVVMVWNIYRNTHSEM